MHRVSECQISALAWLFWSAAVVTCLAAPAAAPPKIDATPPQVAATEPPPDTSLTVAGYLDLGLPTPERSWSGADLGQAATAFEAMVAKDGRGLPRFGSARSGPVFARLLSKENMEPFVDKKVPLQGRFSDAVAYYVAYNRILSAYAKATGRRGAGGIDLVELMGGSLRTSVMILQVVDEFIPTISRDDPKYEARMAGLEKMRSGLATQVAGALQSLTERSFYRTEELLRLVELMQETLPALLAHLTPAQRTETESHLATLAKDAALKDLAPAIQKLQAAIREKPAAGAGAKP